MLLAAMSALFTPPDVISMVLMMGPMLFLYELSVFLVGIFGEKDYHPDDDDKAEA